MKKLLLVLLLVPVAFAAWQSVAAMAILVSVTMLAAVFAVGMGIESQMLKALSKDEFYQLIALALMIVALVSADGILNVLSQHSALTRGQPTLQDAAIVSLNETYERLDNALGKLGQSDNNLATEASRALSCTLSGGGYTVSACGGFTMLGTPFSLGGSIMGYGIAEVSAAKRLITVSKDYALALLLPLGIVLRTFRFSRGAGGFLIAFAISAYIFAPAGIVFVDMLNDQFASFVPESGTSYYDASEYTDELKVISAECEPGMPWGGFNEGRAIDAYDDLRVELKKYIYLVLLKATLGPVIALLLFVGGLKALTGLFGAEVDVSAIARFV